MWIDGETPSKTDYPKNLPWHIYWERNFRKSDSQHSFSYNGCFTQVLAERKKVVFTCALSTYSLECFALPDLEIFPKKI